MAAWKAYLLLLPIFAAFDLLYLGILMKGFYDQEIGELARREGSSLAPRWIAAGLVYLLIPAGIVLFVRPQLAPEDAPWRALLWGALYGLVLYGVYDLTNRSILEKWSLALTLADIAWGMVLCGTTTAILQWLAPAVQPLVSSSPS
jgi:uncharacterized membrane protein